jgi:hypothetical protein
MARTRHIGFFGVGECVGILSDYPAQWPDGSGAINVGDSSPYPFQLSLYNTLRFLWGVKRWKISFDYDYYADLGDDSFPDDDYEPGSYVKTKGGKVSISGESGDGNNISNSNYIHNTAENERYLFCLADEPEYAGFRYAWSFPVTYERRLIKIVNDEIVITENDFTQNISFSIATNSDITQSGFPSNFVKSFNGSIDNLWVAFTVNITRRSASSFNSLIVGAEVPIFATFKFLNANRSIRLGASSPPPSWIVKSEISNVIIEPLEWWSYDGLFNTSTGQRQE